jgi:hypothetical protein
MALIVWSHVVNCYIMLHHCLIVCFVRGIHSSSFSELLVIRFVTDDFKTNMSLMYLGTQLFKDLYTIIAVRSITLCRIGRTPAALNSGPEGVSFGLSYIILRANFWSLCTCE